MIKIIKKYFTLSRASLLGFAITLAVLLWQFTGAVNPLADTSFNRIEHFFYDLRFRLTLNSEQASSAHKIVIVDIDETSLQAEGRWPWSRVKIGKLVEKLAQQGASVVAFDMVFSEPERNPVTEILNNYPNSDIQQKLRKIEALADADKIFSRSFSKTEVILGYFFDDEGSKVGALPPAVMDMGEEMMDGFWIQTMPGIIANLEVLQKSAQGAGSVFTRPDADGIIRRSPLVMAYQGKLYPSLSLAAGMAYTFGEDINLSTSNLHGLTSITSLSISEYPAYTDSGGNVLVPYIGKQKSFPYLSASDVLNDRVEAGVLQGAIILVGTSALGLKDLRTTPLETNYPGVEVHATILKGLLDGGIPFQPDWESGLIRTFIVVFGFLLAALLPNMGSLTMMVTGLASLVAYLSFNYYLWSVSRFDLSQAPMVILVLSITLLNITVGFFQESSRRRNLKDMFGQYVPPAHIDKMMAADNQEAFASDSREMTVLFADIRNFTSISEGLSAEALKQILNDFFTPITQVIFENDGTIDKYVGDLVMAFWGAPLEDPQHRRHALEAALAMLKKTEQLKPIFKAKGLPEISIGIGLNSGLMNVGDMGSHYRRAYTVLGDAVNLSSRLESLTKFYSVRCLVGENTITDLKDYAFREVDRIQVKGKEISVNIFEPIGKFSDLSAGQIKELENYHAGLDLYRRQHWADAQKIFKDLKKLFPETAIYQIYLERITKNKQATLPANWDACFKHSTK